MGGEPQNWIPSGDFLSHGSDKDGGYATMDIGRRDMGSPPAIIFSTGGRIEVYGDLHIQTPECGRAVHFNATYS